MPEIVVSLGEVRLDRHRGFKIGNGLSKSAEPDKHVAAVLQDGGSVTPQIERAFEAFKRFLQPAQGRIAGAPICVIIGIVSVVAYRLSDQFDAGSVSLRCDCNDAKQVQRIGMGREFFEDFSEAGLGIRHAPAWN
jgi:hypothetical protein